MNKNKLVTIVDYKCGNLFSLVKVLEQLNHRILITDKYNEIINAEKLILPGVGSFEVGYKNLKEKNLDEAIFNFIKKGNYLLGICLGMQLLLEESSEFGIHKGLSLISGKVEKLIKSKEIKIPHVGWNSININKKIKTNILSEIKNFSFFYFTHSFAITNFSNNHCVTTTQYGKNNFASMLMNDNVIGVQFHPEKSGKLGEKLINNFLNL